MRRVAILALSLAAGACSAASAPTLDADPSFRVKLERGMCLGACPVYSVEVDATGLVIFTGRRSMVAPHVPCQGERRWRISAAAVTRLRALIDARGFFGLEDSYAGGVTDSPGYTLTVTRRGRTKRVYDYVGAMVGMPRSVAEIEQAVDSAAGDKDCVVGAAAPGVAPTEKLQGAAGSRH
jgi:hypothetical protein